jgi:hypothetical protein
LTVAFASQENFMPLVTIDPSVCTLLETVRTSFPGVPFLALGQTVFWDEPMKAVWRHLLDTALPEALMIAGVHDTDYFAKTTAHLGQDQPYVMMPHDDGRTRDLWSAAGELSSLFGSESVPTKQMFLQNGLPFDWLARGYHGDKNEFYAATTSAWGWRGIVYTEANNVVAHDVPMRQIGPVLLQQLEWGFQESVACLTNPDVKKSATELAQRISGWVTEFLASCSDDCRLSDLYQTLLPRLYEMLLGAPPSALEITSSTQLFRFNRNTASLPRFQILHFFLDPNSREDARKAYDHAVGGSGSGIYTLAEFGEGAIPFDLVIPGIGRGTIHLTAEGVTVQTAPQITQIASPGISSAQQLADLLEEHYGQECVLVGKAVTLVDMLASEFLILFHETASGYTPLTRKLNEGLQAAGLSLPLKPIVRLEYDTWDALASAPPETSFRLPPHLAAAFAQEEITVGEFSARWRAVVEKQRFRIRDARTPRKLRELLRYLEAQNQEGQCWCDRLDEYEAALRALKEIAMQSGILADRMGEHRAEMQMWQRERLALEARKGEDWRTTVQPLRETILAHAAAGQSVARLQQDMDRQIAIRATAFDVPIKEAAERIAATRLMMQEFRRQRRLLERGPDALAARARIEQITREAQMARLRLIHDAFLTTEGLEHTQLRPTAWWLPMVTPQGEWFSAITRSTKARFEMLI